MKYLKSFNESVEVGKKMEDTIVLCEDILTGLEENELSFTIHGPNQFSDITYIEIGKYSKVPLGGNQTYNANHIPFKYEDAQKTIEHLINSIEDKCTYQISLFDRYIARDSFHSFGTFKNEKADKNLLDRPIGKLIIRLFYYPKEDRNTSFDKENKSLESGVFELNRSTLTKEDIERITLEVSDSLQETFDDNGIIRSEDDDNTGNIKTPHWNFISQVYRDSAFVSDREYVKCKINIYNLDSEKFYSVLNYIRNNKSVIEGRTGCKISIYKRSPSIEFGFIQIEVEWKTLWRKLKNIFGGYTSNSGPR